MSGADRANGADLARALSALARPRAPQGRALRRLVAALRALSDSLQTGSGPVQVRVHVFCDPRGRPARPALDITCQALSEEQLEQATGTGEWQERERMHNWSPGQDAWDLQGRTPGRYRSRMTRLPADRVEVLLRLDADAAFYAKSGGDGPRQPGAAPDAADEA
jgi:hypothetical protein